MEKKAQLGIGVLVIVAIAVIVGLVLFQQVAQNVGDATETSPTWKNNQTIASPVVGTIVELTGQELVGTPKVMNRSTGADVPANWTIYECVRPSDGLKGICYRNTGDPLTYDLMGPNVNVSYQYYSEGYIDDAGARSIAGIIVLLAAIAIALVVLGGIKFDW